MASVSQIPKIVPSVYDPRPILDPPEIEALDNLIALIPEEGYGMFSEPDCCRYLRARDWNVKRAFKMMNKTIIWKRQFKPEDITPDEIASEAALGKMYVNGRTLSGNPIVYMKPGKDTSTDKDLKLKYLVYTLERAIEMLPPGSDKIVWLLDLDNFSSKLLGISHIKISIATLNMLQSHYPERLQRAIIVNPPFVFSLFLKAMQPFMSEITRAKIKLLDSKKEAAKYFGVEFDLDTLEAEYGGKNPVTFSADTWMEKERARYATRAPRLYVGSDDPPPAFSKALEEPPVQDE